MTGEEIIVTFKEPWYNDYSSRQGFLRVTA